MRLVKEGLTDAAIKTSETGYLQRKMLKAMEDQKYFMMEQSEMLIKILFNLLMVMILWIQLN